MRTILFSFIIAQTMTLAAVPAYSLPVEPNEFSSPDQLEEITPSPAAQKILSSETSHHIFNSKNYEHIDPEKKISRKLLQVVLRFYDEKKDLIPNPGYIIVVDFNKSSQQQRFYLVNMASGDTQGFLTSHGVGSDPDNTSFAKIFSNTVNSRMSSLGFYLTAEAYTGKHGYSLRLDGLSETNSNARIRSIVIHPASYIEEDLSYAGRSWGCPALDPNVHRTIIDLTKNGTLMYIGI